MDPTLERQMLFRGFCFFLYEIRGFIEMIRLVLSSLASYGSDMHTYRRDPSYTHTSTTPPHTHIHTHWSRWALHTGMYTYPHTVQILLFLCRNLHF